MLESESSALPFGDSPLNVAVLLQQRRQLYYNSKKNAIPFLKNFNFLNKYSEYFKLLNQILHQLFKTYCKFYINIKILLL